MTKEEILTVINYTLTTNVKDWRTILCIFITFLFIVFIITKLVIKIFFKEMDFKIPAQLWGMIALIFSIYIVIVLGTFIYNNTCYERDFVVIPLLKSGNYIDAFMNYYEIITFKDSRRKAAELIPYMTEELLK